MQNPTLMCDDVPTYNEKPVTLRLPVYELPVTGYIIMRKGFIWRNKLFTSIDQGMLQLRFAYPKDSFELYGNRVHRFRNGDYEFVEVKLERSR